MIQLRHAAVTRCLNTQRFRLTELFVRQDAPHYTQICRFATSSVEDIEPKDKSVNHRSPREVIDRYKYTCK